MNTSPDAPKSCDASADGSRNPSLEQPLEQPLDTSGIIPSTPQKAIAGRSTYVQQSLLEQLNQQPLQDSPARDVDSVSNRPDSSLSAASDYRPLSQLHIPSPQSKSIGKAMQWNEFEESKQGERDRGAVIKPQAYSVFSKSPDIGMFDRENSNIDLQRTPDFKLHEADPVKTAPTLRMHAFQYPGLHPEKQPVRTGMLTHKDISQFATPFFVQMKLGEMSKESLSPLELNILAAKLGTAFNESDHEAFKRLLQGNDVLAIEINCPFSDDTCGEAAAIVNAMNEGEKAALAGKNFVLFHGRQGLSATPEIDKGVQIFKSIPGTKTIVCSHEDLPNLLGNFVKQLAGN